MFSKGKGEPYHDTQTLSTRYDTEAVEEAHKEHLSCSRQPGSKIHKDCKEEACYYLERYLKREVLGKESFYAVCSIIVFTVKHILLVGIHRNILQHAHKVERAKFLDKTQAILYREVVIFQGGEEEC